MLNPLITLPGLFPSLDTPKHLLLSCAFWQPNATRQARLEAGAERTL